MIRKSRRNEKSVKASKDQTSGDFAKIIEGLVANTKIIADALKSRVTPGEWKLWQKRFELDEGEGIVDLIFSNVDGRKKETFTLLDVSIPHLSIGQKYELPAKAKAFQKKQNVPATRIKKAIILIRKGTETISARPSRIRCPIIEIQLEKILPKETAKAEFRPQESKPGRNSQREESKQEKIDQDNKKQYRGLGPELLFALKEAIVHECLSTMHKRRNKYIRKGLWRWIEREIMDPNVHFYLIILSTIYQGKAGEILSRKFKTVESYINHSEDVISAIFSKETNLADEIKKASERHKKALRKFLACFSQTPPFEYLRSLFLKEFRSNQDGLKARLSVFTTLNQLLERCGFEGEKETQYPLEILDELGIFQGIMTGNYARLRIDNASKKLKHLVPQAEWEEEDVYQLRNQLAKALNLPPQEFNLNAFLPQAFVQDARLLAEARKEAFRQKPETTQAIPPAKVSQNKDSDRPIRVGDRTIKVKDSIPEIKEEIVEPKYDKQLVEAEEKIAESSAADALPRQDDSRLKRRHNECDESSHRNFEFFGGQLEEDIDAIRLALAMSRHQQEAKEVVPSAEVESLSEEEEDAMHRPPTKISSEKHFPVNHVPPKKKKTASTSTNGSQSRNNPQRRRRSNNRPQHKKQRRPQNGDHGVHR